MPRRRTRLAAQNPPDKSGNVFQRPTNQNTAEANRLREQERARKRGLDDKANGQGLVALLRYAALEVLPHVLWGCFLFLCLLSPFLHLGGSVFLVPPVPRGYVWHDAGGFALSVEQERVDTQITRFMSRAAADLRQREVASQFVERKTPIDPFAYYEAMLMAHQVVEVENLTVCCVVLVFS